MKLSKLIFAFQLVTATLFLQTSDTSAMTFLQLEKVGEIGFPVQAPYHGLIVRGETTNSGKPYMEPQRDLEQKSIKEPIKTYVKGTAIFGDGIGALYCKYDFHSQNPNQSICFGGQNDYVVSLDSTYKELYRLNNDSQLMMYAIYHDYCVTDLRILGMQKSGKWVSYIDSKRISDIYFGGKDSYKEDGGVMYDRPICQGDTIVVTYYRWHWEGNSAKEGEFRFKWDDKAQWFGIEQVVY